MDTLIEKNKFENNKSKFRTIAIDDMKRCCTIQYATTAAHRHMKKKFG